MIRLRGLRAIGLLGALAITLPLTVTARGASSGEPDPEQETQAVKAATVDIVGDTTFVPNRYEKTTFHFSRDVVTVVSGGTITWDNKTTDGHTMTLVAAPDLPTSFNCPICDMVSSIHLPQNGPPVPYLDAGTPNDDDTQADADTLPDFDTASHSNASGPPTPGDSQIVDSLPPNNHGYLTKVTVKITAPAGTTLHYMCAFHPWMQAVIKVR